MHDPQKDSALAGRWSPWLWALLLSGCGSTNRIEADADTASADATTDGPPDSDAAGDATPPCRDGNYVLAFDGHQLVTVPDSPRLRPPTELTVEAWVRFDGIDPEAYHCIAVKTVGTGTADSFALWYDGGRLRGMVNLGAAGSVPVDYAWAPTVGRWYFVALTFDGNTQRLYVDGIAAASTANPQIPMYDDHVLSIGSDFGFGAAAGWFVGRIDEVRLFGVARSRTELEEDAATCPTGAQPDLLGHWRFNEGSGQFVQDGTGNGNRGTLGTTGSAAADDPTWVPSTEPFP